MSKAIYTAVCVKAWDGDSFGNEWRCRASVYKLEELNPGTQDRTRALFRVFEDDGSGNGNHLDSFEDESDAKRYADLYVAMLDAGGTLDTPQGHDMCAWSAERSHYSLAPTSSGDVP